MVLNGSVDLTVLRGSVTGILTILRESLQAPCFITNEVKWSPKKDLLETFLTKTNYILSMQVTMKSLAFVALFLLCIASSKAKNRGKCPPS